MSKLVVATKNKGKVAEIRKKLENQGVEVSSLLELEREIEIVEDADTFADNAIKKARTVSDALCIPALADDSGLEVDALGGRPGIHSARFGGDGLDDEARYRHLIEQLRQCGSDDLGARFRCVLAYVEPDTEPVVFEGTLEGQITFDARGDRGFGYDPIFIPQGDVRTLAEYTVEEKNRISHRAKALAAFVDFFDTRRS